MEDLSKLEEERIAALCEKAGAYPILSFLMKDQLFLSKTIAGYFRKHSREVIWMRIEQADNNYANFWSKFISLGLQAAPRVFSKLVNTALPHSEVGFYFFNEMISEYTLEGKRLCLVIDNFHGITSEDVLEFLRRLGRQRIQGFQIFVLAQHLPLKNTSKLIMEDVLFPFSSELAFSQEEVLQYLQHYFTACDSRQAMGLYRLFQDEPTFLEATVKYAQKEKLRKNCFPAGKEQLFRDYTKAYGHALLTALAVADNFSLEYWLWVGGTPEEFQELISENPFVSRGVSTASFFLHEEYRAYLLGLPGTGPRQIAKSCQAAAQYYISENDYANACLYYERNNDYPALLKTMVLLFMQEQRNVDYLWLFNQVKYIPAEVRRKDLTAELVFTVLADTTGHEALAADSLAYLKEVISREQDPNVLGEYFTLLTIFNYMEYSPDITGNLEHAVRLLPQGSALFSGYFSASENQPFSKGRYIQDSAVLEDMHLRLIKANPQISQLFRGGCAGLGLALQAEYLLVRNRLEEAETLIYQAVSLAMAGGQYAIVLECNIMLLLICMVRGEMAKGFAMLKLMGDEAQALYSSRVYNRFRMIQAWFSIMTGERFSKIPDFVIRGALPAAECWRKSVWMEQYLYAEYLCCKQRYHELHVFIPTLERMLEKREYLSTRSIMRTLILKSIALYHLDKSKQLLETMEVIYRYCIQTGQILEFFFHKEDILKMIQYIRQQPYSTVPPQWLSQIESLSETYQVREDSRSGLQQAYHLTPKEMQVLKYISQGFSNQDIAQEISTTVATVKWYAQQIYGKLHVKNRTEAANKANQYYT